MIVFVGIRAWPIFAHNGLSWLGPGREPRNPDRQHAGHEREPARRGLPPARLAARLRHAADHRHRGRAGHGDRGAVVDLHRRARARAAAQGRDPGDPPAGVGAVGDLRPDRRARARAVRRQPPGHRLAEDLGAELRRAHRRRPGGRGRDPDRDDHADHDRADLRGADRRADVLARGRGRARPQPAARGARGDAARRCARRSSPPPCSRPPARWARR